jgi:Dolichyl-phosphate-mannose-protein mannosyltransferase
MVSAQADSTGTTPGRGVLLGLGGIVLLGLALRCWSLGYGLPAVYNVDEVPILNRALTFAKGDPNPHNFLYPTLYFYALFAWEACYLVVGRLLGWFASASAFQNAFFVDPSGHFLAARLLGALFGTATIMAVYLLGSRLYGRAVGLAAALFLAVAPLAVRDAHYVKLDVPVTFFAALSLWALAAISTDDVRASKPSTWALAGALAGLAISTHYYAAFLAAPFLAAAVVVWKGGVPPAKALTLLVMGGVATVAAFMLTSPFFVFELKAVARDFTELREVDIDRAVRLGWASSLGAYAELLQRSLTWPVLVAALAGLAISLRDLRRGLPAAAFIVAFVLFVSNTYPVSRYLNILLPSLAVLAALGAWRLSQLAGAHAPMVMTALCAVLSVMPAVECVSWDRFLGTDDTRTLAERFVEREIPAESSVLVQPYSVPLSQSREGLLEALRLHLGDESKAPVKNRLQLAAKPYPTPAYRLIYVGEQGKGNDLAPGDVDKIYVSPRAFSPEQGLTALKAQRIEFVVTTEYGAPSTGLAPMRRALERDATVFARFSPYRAGVDESNPPVPPFRHNTSGWIDPALERPGPIVTIWKVSP